MRTLTKRWIKKPNPFFVPFNAVQALTNESHWRKCFPDHDMFFGRMTSEEDSVFRFVVCPAGAYT